MPLRPSSVPSAGVSVGAGVAGSGGSSATGGLPASAPIYPAIEHNNHTHGHAQPQLATATSLPSSSPLSSPPSGVVLSVRRGSGSAPPVRAVLATANFASHTHTPHTHQHNSNGNHNFRQQSTPSPHESAPYAALPASSASGPFVSTVVATSTPVTPHPAQMLTPTQAQAITKQTMPMGQSHLAASHSLPTPSSSSSLSVPASSLSSRRPSLSSSPELLSPPLPQVVMATVIEPHAPHKGGAHMHESHTATRVVQAASVVAKPLSAKPLPIAQARSVPPPPSATRTHNANGPLRMVDGKPVVHARIISSSVAPKTCPTAALVAIPLNALPSLPAASPARSRPRHRRQSSKSTPPTSSRLPKLPHPDPLEHVSSDEGVTRCICGSTEDDGFMIMCEGCSAWQHGDCIGLTSPTDVPEEYYCDLCDPEGEIHQARTERKRLEDLHMSEFRGDSGAHKRRRKKRNTTPMSLGKKKRRRSLSHINNTSPHHTRAQAQMEEDEDEEDEEEEDYEDEEGEEMEDAESEGEEDSSAMDRDAAEAEAAGDEEQYSPNTKSRRMTRGGHRRNQSMSQGQLAASADVGSPATSTTALTSPLYAASTSPAPAHILSPGAMSAASFTTSADVTPAASPTGETKLRSLIFTMEQLANGQMTSPVSGAASLSLSQLAQYKFAYPTPPGANGSAAPSPEGSPRPGCPGGLPSPFLLHRQVSENTANAALTVAAFAANNNEDDSNGGGVSHPGTTASVKLEPFSPVLPPSMLPVRTGVPTVTLPHSMFGKGTPSFMHTAQHSMHANGQGEGGSYDMQRANTELTATSAPPPATAAGVAPPSSSPSSTLAPPSAPLPSSAPDPAQMLLSPNTQAAVATLTGAIPELRDKRLAMAECQS